MEKALGKRAEIARRLRAGREQAGLSQGQVARMLEMARPSVSEMEAGRRRVSAEELVRMAEIYQVDSSWLLGEKGEGEDPAFELAARELSKLREDDLDRVLQLLRTLRRK